MGRTYGWINHQGIRDALERMSQALDELEEESFELIEGRTQDNEDGGENGPVDRVDR